jgi:hypothetical protein
MPMRASSALRQVDCPFLLIIERLLIRFHGKVSNMRKYHEHIDHLEGIGQLIKEGLPPLQVSYVLDISQEFLEPRPGDQRSPGLKNSTGIVFRLDERQLGYLQNQDLTLVLEDGSRWIISIDITGTIIDGRPA